MNHRELGSVRPRDAESQFRTLRIMDGPISDGHDEWLISTPSRLAREVERDNPLFAPDGLLTERDVRRIAQWRWGTPRELPRRRTRSLPPACPSGSHHRRHHHARTGGERRNLHGHRCYAVHQQEDHRQARFLEHLRASRSSVRGRRGQDPLRDRQHAGALANSKGRVARTLLFRRRNR